MRCPSRSARVRLAAPLLASALLGACASAPPSRPDPAGHEARSAPAGARTPLEPGVLDRIAPSLAASLRAHNEPNVRVDHVRAGPFVVVNEIVEDELGGRGWSFVDHVLDARGEAVLELVGIVQPDQPVTRVSATPHALTPALHDAVRAARPSEPLLVDDDDPLLGRARLFLSTVRRPSATTAAGVAVVGPLYRLPRPVRGTEGGERCTPQHTMLEEHLAPALLVPYARLASEELALPSDDDEDETPLEHVTVASLEPPSLVRIGAHARCAIERDFGRYVLRAHALPGVAGGQTIALHDRVRDEHRWVLETRYAVRGSWVEWLGAVDAESDDAVFFGGYLSRHVGPEYAGRGGLVALRARDGAAFRIDVPGVTEDGFRSETVEFLENQCLASLAMEPGREPLGEPDRAHCRAEARTAEIAGGRLRVRSTDGAWTELDLAAIAALVRAAR